MAKTLIDLRAEKGLYLKDVAENTGIPEEELAAIEQSGKVPPDIAQILIDTYYLPDTYFAEVVISSKVQPKNPMKYFFGVSFVWQLLTGIVVSLPLSIVTLIDTSMIFMSSYSGIEGTDFHIIETTAFKFLNSLFIVAVSIVSCIMFVKFLLKRTNYVGDIKKYQFIFYVIPSAASAFLMALNSLLNMFAAQTGYEEPLKALLLSSSTLILSVASSLLSAYACAVLLKTAITENEDEKFKHLHRMAVWVTVSAIVSMTIYLIMSVINQSFNAWTIITDMIVYGMYVVIAWFMATFRHKNEKLTYLILPLISISDSIIFGIINAIIK